MSRVPHWYYDVDPFPWHSGRRSSTPRGRVKRCMGNKWVRRVLGILTVLFVLYELVGFIFGWVQFGVNLELTRRVEKLEGEVRELKTSGKGPSLLVVSPQDMALMLSNGLKMLVLNNDTGQVEYIFDLALNNVTRVMPFNP